MKFESDVSLNTFEIQCIAGDNSSDAVADQWPVCRPGKVANQFITRAGKLGLVDVSGGNFVILLCSMLMV